MKTRRLKYASIHFGITLLILFCGFALVFHVWYPAPFHLAVSVTVIFILVATITLILGPVLTLVISKPGETSLRLDLFMIATIQIAAFLYGMWVIAEGRPAWIVFNVDRFDIVRANDLDNRKIGTALVEYQRPSWLGPKWVSATLPSDPGIQEEILFEAIFAGIDIQHRPNLYRPLHEQMDSIVQQSLPLDKLQDFNPASSTRILLSQWPDADGWLPVAAHNKSVTALISTHQRKVISIVDLRPWQE